MKTKIFTLFTLLSTIHLSCEHATKEELLAIEVLNKEFSDFEFESGNDLVGVYLNMRIIKDSWDSVELKNAYDASVGRFKRQTGIPWAYLSVYSKDNKYLFTISKAESGPHSFFIDKGI